MRALWLSAGAVATVFALLITSGVLWSAFAYARPPIETTSRSIPFKLSRLKVIVARGNVNVSIHPGEAGELFLERSLRWSKQKPGVKEDWDEQRTLRLDVSCPGMDRPDAPLCQADYTLFVPEETDIEAQTANGSLDVNGIFGDVRMTSESGELRVYETSGTVWARSGSGDVRGIGLSGGEADVETGSGHIDLSFDTAPTKVRAVVRTRGDVAMVVPDLGYDVTASAKRADIDVKKDPTSPRKITIQAQNALVMPCCE
ncbi:DUF4097 family beta strand repeat-containing protein [Nonomuraea sp. NPDC026600]|uniref:DUF4097 family beta strand repeat-containing protein n=1 Tax=Nonomuraea sp. NPDC026600 TaxID=3155363 RepID=UPI0033CA8C6A